MGPGSTFVLVHGAWHGGWCYSRVARILRHKGHEVFVPTLTGLGERSHLYSSSIDLSTHVRDILGVVKYERLNDIVLVGHSYGGLVITGVADAIPDKIRSLVYLDAFFDQDGQCLLDVVTPEGRAALTALAQAGGGHTLPCIPSSVFGVNADDQPWVDAMCTPHPFAAFSERLTLTGAYASVPRRAYVFAKGWDSHVRLVYETISSQVGWETNEFDCGHDVMIDMPRETADLLETAALRSN